MQYIDRKRFEESKRLLAATALPVKAIVERVGYTDEANFSRKFKNMKALRPLNTAPCRNNGKKPGAFPFLGKRRAQLVEKAALLRQATRTGACGPVRRARRPPPRGYFK